MNMSSNAKLSFFTLIICFIFLEINSQSTCPVQNNHQQRCKCGIKIDGHIYIYCARKQLKQLPKFTRSSILYDELILSGNQIQNVSFNSFNGLKVKRLFLDDNPLVNIDFNALNELANYLEELIISVNIEHDLVQFQRAQVPPKLFQNLLNLKMVKLNGLEWNLGSPGILQLNTFNRTRKLEVIHLVDCGLHTIESNSLNGVETSLYEFNLDNNQLTTTEEIFKEVERMTRLEKLNLSRNRIRRLERYVTGVSSQNSYLNDLYLDLSFNGLISIDEYAFGAGSSSLASALTKLNLNNNELNQFQLGFLNQIVNIKELHLDYNKIEFIPDNVFANARQLENLSIKGNFITHLSSEYVFAGLHFNLRRLNLASNKIQMISRRVFLHASKLKELNLEKNQLGSHFEKLTSHDDLVNTFEGIESELKLLNLENNKILPNHLWSLVNLLNVESLKLGHNQLSELYLTANKDKSNEKLAKIFEFYRNLTYLDMQNASLRQMPYFLGLNRTLLSFNLAQNKMCHINAINLRMHYNRLKYFNLNSNPLNCDCNLISLRQWIDELDLLSLDTQTNRSYSSLSDQFHFQREPTINWKCSAPKALLNKQLSQLNIENFICESNSNKCLIDQDEAYFVPTTTTTTTTTTTSMLIKETIQIVESNTIPTYFFLNNINNTKKVNNEKSVEQLLASLSTSKATSQFDNQKRSEIYNSSFFGSIEIKQTLLGSFIGALFVVICVAVLTLLIKTSRRKWLLGKNASLFNDKDKSTNTTTTTSATASTSPYDLGKLSLQTLCVGSASNSSSSSSSASSSSRSSGGTTNTCACLNCKQDITSSCLFTKMDPLRLTMSNAHNPNRNSFHQNYLNCHLINTAALSQYQFTNNNANNLHYLSSHLPCSSPTETSSTAAFESFQLNEKLDNDETNHSKFLNSKLYFSNINNQSNCSENNNYDKLHQQQRLNTCSSGSSFRPTFSPNLNNYTARLELNAANCSNCNILNAAVVAAAGANNLTETTPFLILTNGDVNRLVDFVESSTCSNQNQGHHDQQHTYHEINDVLMNLHNLNQAKATLSRQSNEKSIFENNKNSGMYI